ncbi:ribonuclease H family protein [Allohahella marinimesophila]|uniref:RNase H type-1 domain-containing protein n=1 Tax=Allohahella marinimesophila TaxID=1054972 RepID=A0ABP7Q7F7_9GAMM
MRTYAVWGGDFPGLYPSWDEARLARGKKVKAFDSFDEAQLAYQTTDGPESRSLTPEEIEEKKALKAAAMEEANLNYQDFDTIISFDFSCRPNPGAAGIALTLYEYGVPEEVWFGRYQDNSTAPRSELLAFREALKLAEKVIARSKKVMIVAEASYAFDYALKQIPRQLNATYLGNTCAENSSRDLAASCYYLFSRLSPYVEVRRAPKNSGQPGVKFADLMARTAVDFQQRELVRWWGSHELSVAKKEVKAACAEMKDISNRRLAG